LVTRY